MGEDKTSTFLYPQTSRASLFSAGKASEVTPWTQVSYKDLPPLGTRTCSP